MTHLRRGVYRVVGPTFRQQGTKGQGFGKAPVHALAGVNHVAPLLVHLLHLPMSSNVLRQRCDGVPDLPRHAHLSGSDQACTAVQTLISVIECCVQP